MLTIKLKCRPELLLQWRHDVERNPRAFVHLLTPEMLVAVVHDAIAAIHLNGLLARLNAPTPIEVIEAKDLAHARPGAAASDSFETCEEGA